MLYREAQSGGTPAPVLDPNVLSPDGSIAVAQWSVSPDGRTLAYTTAAGGSDLLDIHLRNLATGRDLPEVLHRVKFTDISWTRNSKGFYYSRFRGSAERRTSRTPTPIHWLWYTPSAGRPNDWSSNVPIIRLPGSAAASLDDGRWLYTYSGSGTTNNRLWIADLKNPTQPTLEAPAQPLVTAEDAFHYPLGVAGNALFIYTNWRAPHGRVMAAALGDSNRSHWRTIIPGGVRGDQWRPLGWRPTGPHLPGGRTGRASAVRPKRRVATGSGAAGRRYCRVMRGRNDGSDFFFAFTSYLRPTTVYRYDLKSGQLQPFEEIKAPFKSELYETRAAFYHSKDGTRVPIFVTARKGLVRDGSHPTLLYGYGGFDANITPFYSPAVAGWLELGGVYAVANIRGGGEYGEAWHEAGKRAKKQNVFDPLHRRRRVSGEGGICHTRDAGDQGRLQRRPPGRSRHDPATRSLCRRASGRRSDGHAALPEVHWWPVLGR